MIRKRFFMILLAILTVATGCGKEELSQDIGISKEAALAARKVSVAPVERRDFQRSFRSTGSLSPREQARLRALVEGPFEAVLVDIGDEVETDQVLFRTRPTDPKQAVQTAQAAWMTTKANLEELRAWRREEEIEVLRAQLAQASADSERLEVQRERIKSLFENKSIVSPSQWDEARTAAAVAKAKMRVASEQLRIALAGPTPEAIRVAEAQVAQASAALAQSRQMLEDTTVEAPFPGVITGRFRKTGDYAKKGDEILEITNLSPLEAEFNVPERFASVVREGLSVDVQVESIRLKRKGNIFAVNQAIEPRTRTFLVKVEVDNSDRAIKSGAFCTGTFLLPTVRDVAAVPIEALQDLEGRSFVWVANNRKAGRVFVRVGEQDQEYVEIREGLTEGDTVVIEGAGALAEGDELEIIPSA